MTLLRPLLRISCASLWPSHKAHGVAAVCQRVTSYFGLDEMEVVTRLNAGCSACACSHVTRHTSHVTRHTSRITRHTSHVTCHPERPHVIVDLNTWTDGHVIASVASRHNLAPVVVSAIGHPGTSGAYSHTHALVDAVVAPAELYAARSSDAAPPCCCALYLAALSFT